MSFVLWVLLHWSYRVLIYYFLAAALFRALSVSEVKAAVKETIQLQKDFPDVVAGFDMVKTPSDHNSYDSSCGLLLISRF